MRKWFVLVIGMCIFLFSACSNQGNYVKSISKDDTIGYSRFGFLFPDRLQKFIDNVDKVEKDRINIIETTTEGDPIITQLYFNGEDIEISIDNSNDGMAGQAKNEIQYKTIKGGNKLKENLTAYLNEHFPQ